MKIHLFLYSAIICIAIAQIVISNKNSKQTEVYYINGDEAPGIAGTKNKPDTAIVWYDRAKRQLQIRYVK